MKKISIIERNLLINEVNKFNNSVVFTFFIQNESEITILLEHESYFSKDSVLAILKRKKFNVAVSSIASLSFFIEGGKEIVYFYVSVAKKEKNSYQVISNLFGSVLSGVQKNTSDCLFLFFSKTIHDFFNKKMVAIHLQKILLLKLYQYNEFFSDKKRLIFTDFEVFLVADKKDDQELSSGLEQGLIIGQSINFSRYLSDLPANLLYPKVFTELVSQELAKNKLNCQLSIFNKEQLIEMGMQGIISIGKGSVRDPYFLVLKYEPEIKLNGKTIALVGKGITFDTGGISIKPSDNMEDMKTDMSGAASVVAATFALAKLKSQYTIYALTPLAENMVDGNSIRPGDIVTFYNGKTAEVKNTDAEGRIVLADALAYASKNIKPDLMIDLATLTGACSVALGPVYAGLMSEDDLLVEKIIKKGFETGDICWRLPLEDSYKPNMHSDFADMANIGTKGYRAGTTMGGMFLREFVDPSISWAHIDIAGVSNECPFKSYIPSYGATGFGVHLLISLFSE